MCDIAAILKFNMVATSGRCQSWVLVDDPIGVPYMCAKFHKSPPSEIFCHIFRLSRWTTGTYPLSAPEERQLLSVPPAYPAGAAVQLHSAKDTNTPSSLPGVY